MNDQCLLVIVCIMMFKHAHVLQINKTMVYYTAAEPGIAHLDPAARWPVWSALVVYRKILDAVETNGFDNINKRAYVPKPKKMALLPFSWLCANLPNHAGRISKSIWF